MKASVMLIFMAISLLLVLMVYAITAPTEGCGMGDRESLTDFQIETRNATLELAAQYFNALGPDKSYSVTQIVNALRALKVEREPMEKR